MSSLSPCSIRSQACFPISLTIARLAKSGKQTLYSGLAFSRDGKHIFASMASLTDPMGGGKDATGSGVVVYSFNERKNFA